MYRAGSFLNWRIYWLAFAWLVEETVRYGLLFWCALVHFDISCIQNLIAWAMSCLPVMGE